MRAFLDGLYRASGVAAAICLGLIAALVLSAIVGRMFDVLVPGTDDISGFLLVATSFLALAHTLKARAHVRVELVLHRLSPGARRPIELGALAVAALIIGYFAYFAIELAWLSWRFGDMSQGVVAIPLWIPQGIMALGLVILAIALLDEFVLVLRGRISLAETEGLAERGASSAE